MGLLNSEPGKGCICVNIETRQVGEQFLSHASDSISVCHGLLIASGQVHLLSKEVNQ